MKSPPFEYHRPSSLEEALHLVERYGDACKPLAGGQSLVPLMNLRLAFPAHVIDLNGIEELAFIRDEGQSVAFGAMVRQRHAERSELSQRAVPLLTSALQHVGHFQIRNRGTIGGSLVHADPSAEAAVVWAALDGTVTVANETRGERTIAAGELFSTYFTTSIAPDELLVKATFPKLSDNTGWSFQEIARRRGDFAVVDAAACITLAGGKIRACSIALGGVGSTVVRLREAEGVIVGDEPTPDAFARASEVAAREIQPAGDATCSAEFKRHLAGVIVRRALAEAASLVP